MRILFFGTSAFAVPSLERLARHHDVVCCVTQPDRPQGRGLQLAPSPVKTTALALRLPLAQPERLQAAEFTRYHAELGVVIAYGKLITRAVLTTAAHGMLGVHPSLLPKYRGAAPVPWALLHGATTTGVTIFRLSERLDDGDIVVQRLSPIAPEDNAETLLARLAHEGADALLEAVEAMAQGRARFAPQDHQAATFAPKLTKAQGQVDWTQPAARVEGLVRAAVPWPGATTTWQGQPLKIWAAAAQEPSGTQPPGTILRVPLDGILVAAGQGAIVLREVQPAGKRRMPAKDFIAGYRVKVGDRFGV